VIAAGPPVSLDHFGSLPSPATNRTHTAERAIIYNGAVRRTTWWTFLVDKCAFDTSAAIDF
jgi:hypothetical protein